VTREEVFEEYKDFGPQFQTFPELAKDPINLWQMRALLPALPTWTKGRLALLGDSAHGTLPTLGQGAAMAVEDAGALGCMLPLGTKPEEVPSRLAAYQDLRKERGEFVTIESLEQVTVPEKRGAFYRCKSDPSAPSKADREFFSARDARFPDGLRCHRGCSRALQQDLCGVLITVHDCECRTTNVVLVSMK
jgi:2-polyprenyl-6-methoxyphenol hydroxylase-like FAD-dependent oxidoreductase